MKTKKQITITLDPADALTPEILRSIAGIYRAHGRNDEAKRIVALAQQEPEIDPGG